MPRNAQPRKARLRHVSVNRMIIAAQVSDGPATEIGKLVNVSITPADLPALRALVDALERQASSE